MKDKIIKGIVLVSVFGFVCWGVLSYQHTDLNGKYHSTDYQIEIKHDKVIKFVYKGNDVTKHIKSEWNKNAESISITGTSILGTEHTGLLYKNNADYVFDGCQLERE